MLVVSVLVASLMLLELIITVLNIIWSYCYVNYEIFEGFDINYNATGDDAMFEFDDVTVTQVTGTVNAQTLSTANINVTSTMKAIKMSSVKMKNFKAKCPETEHPIRLGTYEIPTQRDLVLFTKRILLKMFNSYHEKTLFLLKDIKEVTKATEEFENKCIGQAKAAYKKCVKWISKQCITFTKDFVSLMEEHKAAVADLMEETTCNMTEMKTSPIQLIKKLATDEVLLEFALPSFLRLIGGCSTHCFKQTTTGQAIRRPLRHMTDQDLIVKHLLTRKNYIQLIKDSD